MISERLLACLFVAMLGASASGQTAVWRMNCGGEAEPAPWGPDFSADQAYSGAAGGGYVGGTQVELLASLAQTPRLLGGAPSGFVDTQRTARVGWDAYRFDLDDGDYLVRLHFTEFEKHGPLLRIFDLTVEGLPVFNDLDVADVLGTHYGGVYVLLASVADGRLDIEIPAGGDPALLNAVEVWTAPAAQAAPVAPTGIEIEPSYRRNVLTWDPAQNATVAGYEVYRSDSAGGPFALLARTWANPPRYFDDAAIVGQDHYYRVAGVDHLGQVGPQTFSVFAAALDPHASDLPVYELAIDPQDWAALNEAFLIDKKETFPGTLTFEGVDYPTGVRYRGQSSLASPKKSWKFKFPSTGRFQGRKQLNLKAHFLEETMLIQALSMQLLREAGHPTPDSWAAHLEVNGEYLGVFQALEKIDEDYIESRGRDVDGSVYKADSNQEYELNIEPDLDVLMRSFEKETNESDPYDDLIAFIDVVNLTSDADFPATIASVFDIDGYLTYIAANAFLVDFEADTRNYHLLHDFDLERWEVIAWDNDASFSYPYMPLDFGTEGSWVVNNILKTRVLADPGFRWRYVEKIRSLLAGPADPGGALGDNGQFLFERIRTSALADVYKGGWEDGSIFLGGPNALASRVQTRLDTMTPQLAGFQPAQPPTRVWINELMAENLDTLADEAGEFEDWVELYNASATTIDVGGMYLTDDLTDPTAWQIPAGTQIEPFEHLLIWADKDPLDGPLHAEIKLSKSGEAVALFDTDGTSLLDVYHFGPQLPDVAAGRALDGGALFRQLATPTPGTANTDMGNVPPLIAWVRNDPGVPSSLLDVTISCVVRDTDGVEGADLMWAVQGAAFTITPMTTTGHGYFEAVLPAQPDGTVIEYWFQAQDELGATSALPGEAPMDLFTYGVADAQPVDLFISEIMADNDATVQDETGAFEDWIELVNTSDSAINLAGMFLTDDLADTTKWSFPGGTVLAPGAQLLVWADDNPLDGPLHASFGLSKSGEAVGLFDTLANGNALLHSFSFGAQEQDVALGYLPTDGTLLFKLVDPSPGSANEPDPGNNAGYYASASTAPPVLLDSSVSASSGSTLVLDVSAGPPSGQGVLALGLRPQNATLGALGQLLVDPVGRLVRFQLDPAGAAALPIQIPTDPSLIGITTYFQTYALGTGFSNGLAVTIAP